MENTFEYFRIKGPKSRETQPNETERKTILTASQQVIFCLFKAVLLLPLKHKYD